MNYADLEKNYCYGRIRRVVIAARDDLGGAMKLMEYSPFIKRKNIQVTWLDNELGDMQRAFQAIRELLFNDEEENGAMKTLYLIAHHGYVKVDATGKSPQMVVREILKEV